MVSGGSGAYRISVLADDFLDVSAEKFNEKGALLLLKLQELNTERKVPFTRTFRKTTAHPQPWLYDAISDDPNPGFPRELYSRALVEAHGWKD